MKSTFLGDFQQPLRESQEAFFRTVLKSCFADEHRRLAYKLKCGEHKLDVMGMHFMRLSIGTSNESIPNLIGLDLLDERLKMEWLDDRGRASRTVSCGPARVSINLETGKAHARHYVNGQNPAGLLQWKSAAASTNLWLRPFDDTTYQEPFEEEAAHA
jgi:hypothetical protein